MSKSALKIKEKLEAYSDRVESLIQGDDCLAQAYIQLVDAIEDLEELEEALEIGRLVLRLPELFKKLADKGFDTDELNFRCLDKSWGEGLIRWRLVFKSGDVSWIAITEGSKETALEALREAFGEVG